MFRIMQTSVVLAITLIMVNETQAGKPVHGTGSSHDPRSPITTKNPVHGTGSSHDPRSPSNTHHRDYSNWGHRYWNSRYGCEYCWSQTDGCYFYFYAPANCYYPITVIELFPPVCTPAVPVIIARTPRG